MIKRYGFIVKAEHYQHPRDNTEMNTLGFSTQVVGVCSDEQAIVAAKSLIEQEVQVIELCGGFGVESAEKIIAELNSPIPIGYVTFNQQEQRKLTEVVSEIGDNINKA
ncbi:DUF6506 family protein [Vibrio tapetis]|uniref:Uncharacterized protein n=1 Tax=Vibrio tapetis subsp. tapetis TaxID=1671868 RepID=A0A2N8ZM06_9VIBR|nr:DUF6506 family protein [Vibrio tapetis]SON52951.1 conserved protein of unknown function [Vibrio tapetis subsp. tapetis]